MKSHPRHMANIMSAALLLAAVPGHSANYNLTVKADREKGPVNRFWENGVGSPHMYSVLNSAQNINLRSAYALAAGELKMKYVRGHGILNDDVGIYREVNGQPVYTWTNYDSIMDYILSIGMKPVVELSFMPSDLASGPATFGWYNGNPGNITPPRDYGRWRDLCYEIVMHAQARYGAAEIETWYWEVWNEPDIGQFFTGSRTDYFKMYDYAVEGMVSANPRVQVGGPSIAIVSGGWIEAFIDHCMKENFADNAKSSVKVDFISWHIYPHPDNGHAENISGGNWLVSGIIQQKMSQYPGLKLKNFLTEWNTSYQGGNSYHNEIGASFVAKVIHGMFPEQNGGRPAPDMAAFWVVSDVWEEWDATFNLSFGPMGMVMRSHDVKKPSYLAFQMLSMTGTREISFEGGTTANTGLNGFATLNNAGTELQVLIYDHHYGNGDEAPVQADQVSLNITGLNMPYAQAEVIRYGVDRYNNNCYWTWKDNGSPAWPSEAVWTAMQAAGELDPIGSPETQDVSSGTLALNFEQLQPGVSLFVIRNANPVGTTRRQTEHRLSAADKKGNTIKQLVLGTETGSPDLRLPFIASGKQAPRPAAKLPSGIYLQGSMRGN